MSITIIVSVVAVVAAFVVGVFVGRKNAAKISSDIKSVDAVVADVKKV